MVQFMRINDYYFGVMQIEPPFEENEEESKESEFWNDLYENEYRILHCLKIRQLKKI